MSDQNRQRLPRGFRKRRANRLGMEIPINLERILMDAARDEAFRERLLEDPLRAAADGGFDLKGSEKAMLAAMDRSTVEAMVQRFGPARSRKNAFATGVAAAVAGSMIISVATGCAESAGISPDDAETEADVLVDFIDRPSDGISEDFPDLTDADDPVVDDDEDSADLTDADDPVVDDDEEPGEDAADDAEEDSDG